MDMMLDTSLRRTRHLALILTLLSVICLALPAAAQSPDVKVIKDASGSRLQVGGEMVLEQDRTELRQLWSEALPLAMSATGVGAGSR